jgi:hypothetical protein
MLKRNKSGRERAMDLITKYLKLKAAGKAVEGATKAAKWTAYGKIAKNAVERAPKKALLAVAGGVGTAAAIATARKRRSEAPTTA